MLLELPSLNRALVDDILGRPLLLNSPTQGCRRRTFVERLWQGKATLHRRRASLPARETVRLVIELQRMALPLIARRRALRSWERSWEIEP